MKATLVSVLLTSFLIINAQEFEEKELHGFKTCKYNHSVEEFDSKTEHDLPSVFIGNYATESDVWKLESTPGSHKCIYMDMDGEDLMNTSWNKIGKDPQLPASLVREVFLAIAADFMMFDVNVTTSRAVYDSYATADRQMCVFANFDNAGAWGIAGINSFGKDFPCLYNVVDIVNPTTVQHFVQTAHEIGHTLGLEHDGKLGDGEYYKGHGEFIPIMGAAMKAYAVWSKGDYAGGTNKEDDIAMITAKLGLRSDDITQERILNFESDGTILSNKNYGVVENSTDSDVWVFEMSTSGIAQINVNAVIDYTDLDVEASLLDEFNNVITTVNVIGSRDATIYQSLPAGIYKVSVASGQELGVDNGWTKYSSFGYYEITGHVDNAKLQDYDLSISNGPNLGSICSSNNQVDLDFEIENTGLNSFTSLDFEIYINGNLSTTITKNLTLLAGANQIVSISPVLSFGSHSLTVVVKDPQSREINLFDNEFSTDYELTDGLSYKFFTDYSLFSTNSPSWVLTNSSNQTTAESKDLEIATEGQFMVQEACLLQDECYGFTMTKSLKICSSMGVNAYVQGATYNSGDRVVVGTKIYRARWWTQSAPPNSSWELVDECALGNPVFGFFDHLGNTEFQFQSSNYSSPETHQFCTPLVTNVRATSESRLRVFPNPATNQIYLQNFSSGQHNIKIYNVLGSVVFEGLRSESEQKIDLSGFQSGIYFIVVDAAFSSEFIIKK